MGLLQYVSLAAGPNAYEDLRRITDAVRSSGKNYRMMETTLYTRQFFYVKELLDICGIRDSQMPKLFESYEVVGTFCPASKRMSLRGAKPRGNPLRVPECPGDCHIVPEGALRTGSQ